ncbi:hypothetical protein BSL78_21747 [Apostichopus japonicus]|uniref:Uncharacterized protein n=1 Tax=Stichopus japonicus TaxID=307972 RepID=A0A2G8K072_STIJA|nr:hypothetical protein BSL78_21747 [Apostichopus japonicus]
MGISDWTLHLLTAVLLFETITLSCCHGWNGNINDLYEQIKDISSAASEHAEHCRVSGLDALNNATTEDGICSDSSIAKIGEANCNILPSNNRLNITQESGCDTTSFYSTAIEEWSGAIELMLSKYIGNSSSDNDIDGFEQYCDKMRAKQVRDRKKRERLEKRQRKRDRKQKQKDKKQRQKQERGNNKTRNINEE